MYDYFKTASGTSGQSIGLIFSQYLRAESEISIYEFRSDN